MILYIISIGVVLCDSRSRQVRISKYESILLFISTYFFLCNR